jgi:hypothetical protein
MIGPDERPFRYKPARTNPTPRMSTEIAEMTVMLPPLRLLRLDPWPVLLSKQTPKAPRAPFSNA